uniref:Minor spike protein n=1 Tax=Cacopsylla melanoneura TaxID=428564 RepID=A0A8D8M0F8_9HEMI
MLKRRLPAHQQVSEIMLQMLTQAQTAGQYFTNDQIKAMTRKVSAVVDLVHQQMQNQRYGSSSFSRSVLDFFIFFLIFFSPDKSTSLSPISSSIGFLHIFPSRQHSKHPWSLPQMV